MRVIDVSRISSNSLVGRILRLPLELLPTDLEVPVVQGPMRGFRWTTGAGTHGCWLGTYEMHTQRWFESVARPGDVLYDIGANVGFFTLLGAALVGPTGRVCAFEPLPRNLRLLRRHVERNGLRQVRVFAAAVSARPGKARFQELDNASAGFLQADGALEVESVTLDGLIASGETPDPSIMKIDVEGAELDVLRGAEQVLRRRRPALYVETHGPELRRDVRCLLETWGYVVEDFPPRRPNPNVLVASARA